MAEAPKTPGEVLPDAEAQAQAGPVIETAPGPHLSAAGDTTRRMMFDVLIGLAPVAVAAIWFFRGPAVAQLIAALVGALATEAVFAKVRRKPIQLADGSAAITAVILAFSLPPQLPLVMTLIGAVVAVALGKMVFGGLGYNIFNPAMVGRAFLMISFSAAMVDWSAPAGVDATTGATPLADGAATLRALAVGNVSGSLGETSAIAILIGGLWLLLRRSADWRLTLGMLIGVAVLAPVDRLLDGVGQNLTVVEHLLSGSVMLGAFFIVTDPVTSPLTRSGRWIFGLGVGLLVVVIRLFGSQPEGVMYAVLLMNAVTTLINRWTRTKPVGGHVVAKVK